MDFMEVVEIRQVILVSSLNNLQSGDIEVSLIFLFRPLR